MKIDNNFMLAFVLANRAKKRLEEKGADVSKNFSVKHALYSSMTPMPMVSNLLLSNEVEKLEPEITTKAQVVIDTYVENTITEIGKIGVTETQLEDFKKALPVRNKNKYLDLIQAKINSKDFIINTPLKSDLSNIDSSNATAAVKDMRDFVDKTIEVLTDQKLINQTVVNKLKVALPAFHKEHFNQKLADALSKKVSTK